MSIAQPILPFQDNTSAALAWLLRQEKNHLDMSEAIYRQEADVVRTLADGVLLRHTVTGGYLLSANNPQTLKKLLDAVPDQTAALTLHEDWAQSELPPREWHRCFLWYRPGFDPPVFPLNFEIWPLDEGDIPDALACDPGLPVDQLRSQIGRKKVYGACIQDQLVGTAGTAPTGEIAWISVRPDLRGQGIGTTLLRWMLRRELRQGHAPYLLLPEEKKAFSSWLGREGLSPAPGVLLLS